MSTTIPPIEMRVAGAPISWGVCEVPGWGWQYDASTVLAQMGEVGLAATEFGPDDFLPADPQAKADVLASQGLKAVGQFVPVVLHDPGHDPLPAGRGLTATLHPHVGTMVESGEETDRVLAGSSIGLCLDTGHLLIGGGDPVAVAKSQPGRIAHVHLKDVRLDWARKVRAGEATYTEAVAGGMYVPLGEGDVDIAAIVNALEDDGYAGWYVLEQDTILPEEPDGAGPVDDVRTSLYYLLGVAGQRSGVGV